MACFGSGGDTWRMSLATCVVSPHKHGQSDCSATGGGPGSLSAATFVDQPWKTRGSRVHQKCMRTDAAHDTLEECLPSTICPTSVLEEDGNDWSCAQDMCYHTAT